MRLKTIKKLNSNKGESLVETLTAILIISLIFAFLCNTIASANKINSMTKAKHPEIVYSEGGTSTTCHLYIGSEKGTNDILDETITVHKDKTGNYLYY